MKKVVLLVAMCLMTLAMNAQTTKFVDLGLPSGTKWKNTNESGFYPYDEAVSRFGNRLPTKEQWEELVTECQWSWTGIGYKVIGSNGNSIILHAEGSCDCSGSVTGTDIFGYYWSSSPCGSFDAFHIVFHSDSNAGIHKLSRCNAQSVRLVQTP